MGTKMFIKMRISPPLAPESSGGRAGATALLRPPLTALAKSRADIGHDAIDNAVANVAAVCQAALTTAPKKAVETSLERPTRILVARVFRVHELPREDIDFAVGHLARSAIDSSDSRVFRPDISPPPCIHNITSLNRKGSPTEPAHVGVHPIQPRSSVSAGDRSLFGGTRSARDDWARQQPHLVTWRAT